MSQQRSWGKWIAIGCGSLLALAIVVVAGIFLVVTLLTAGPEEAARDFCAAAAAGNYQRAHDHCSVPLKESQSLDVFTAAVKSNPSLFDIADTTFTDRSIDLAGAKLAGTATLKSGTV